MLTQQQREILKISTTPADFRKAATRYTELSGLYITPKYIGEIVRGQKKSGQRTGKHDMNTVLKAIADAVKERKQETNTALQGIQEST